MITITQLKEVSTETLQDINQLLPQLRTDSSEHRGSLSDLREIVGNTENIITLVAKDDSRIVGMAALYVIVKVGQRIGHIDEVIVDAKYRGQGLGEKLVAGLIAAARSKKVTELFLTSRSERVAAIKLYQKLGFTPKDTSVFRLKL